MNFLKKLKFRKKLSEIECKIYFIILALLYIDAYILICSLHFELSYIEFLPELVIIILTTIAFFSFIWKGKTLNQLFWKISFTSAIFWRIGSLAVFATSNSLGIRLNFLFLLSNVRLITISVIGLIIIPFAFLYFYAFRSDVWKR